MDCCQNNQKKGIIAGLIYGLTPHIGCIAFVLFSIIGATTAVAVLRPLLFNRYFFHVLILISLVFASISAFIYLKKNKALSFLGIKRKKSYLLILFGTTIAINLLLFMVIFPITANMGPETSFLSALSDSFKKEAIKNQEGNFLSIKVDIPCSGHAFLITEELKKIDGVKNTRYRFPNFFDIIYNDKTSEEQILSLEVFEAYKATINKNGIQY